MIDYIYRFDEGENITVTADFSYYLEDVADLIKGVKKLRKILNNEILDMLPFDIAEEVQELFNEML